MPQGDLAQCCRPKACDDPALQCEAALPVEAGEILLDGGSKRYHTELSETSLGHSKLSELLSQAKRGWADEIFGTWFGVS